jgi:uncharacterized protein (DUF2141 family)
MASERIEMRPGSCLSFVAALAAVFLSSGRASAMDGDASHPPGDGQSCTGHPGDVRLYVDVDGVRSSQGLVAVTLYADDPHKFLARRGSLYVGRVPAHQGTTRVCIWVPKPGIWAIATYHDENGNRKYDRNAFGMPKEGAGFSNNPPTFFGLPSFQRVRFPVHGPDMEIRVKLRYP